MDRVKSLMEQKRPLKWLFYGDSITHGVVHCFGSKNYCEHFAERVRGEMGRNNDLILNSAISGNNSASLLENFEWRVGEFKPDAAFLMIGMNDCNENSVVDLPQFKKNLNILADKFAELGTLLIVQTTCPIIPNTSPEREPYFSDYMDAVRDFAEERDLPLIDHEKYWQENPNLLFYRMSNAFHPNAKGHLVFAEKIFKDLDIWDPDSSTCKLFKL